MSYLLLINRVLHIVATCTSLGGLFYARMVLWPLLPELREEDREQFLKKCIRRYSYIKWSGVGIVVVTGLLQLWYVWPNIADQNLYLLYLLIKMFGAAGLFSITFLLALPHMALNEMRRKRAFWSGLNILCGLLILVGAALMRTVDRI
jgi:uncharacterized membrane protein